LVHIDGFSEQGSLLPLQIHSDTETSLRTDFGARANYTWHLGNVLVIPTLTVAWEHEYEYSSLPITVSSVEFPGQTVRDVTVRLLTQASQHNGPHGFQRLSVTKASKAGGITIRMRSQAALVSASSLFGLTHVKAWSAV